MDRLDGFMTSLEKIGILTGWSDFMSEDDQVDIKDEDITEQDKKEVINNDR